MVRDITLGDTIYIKFTTRAFATGIPTVLAGTPVLSVLEDNNATPITAGVSVSVDRASVVGLNEATIVATSGNGYEAGKGYVLYISTGTVAGVSVVGEVVGDFTIQASAAIVALVTTTYAEPGSVPAATASIKDMLHWVFSLSRNKGTQTDSSKVLRNDADGADIATSTITDDGTTFTRDEWT